MIEELEQLNGELEKTNEKLNQEIERLKEELEFEKASNKELISTGAELENKLYEEHKQTKTQLEMHIAFNKQLLGELEKLDKENKRLNNIIKEVREKIKNHLYAKTILSDMYSDNEIFEFILEKIGSDKE